MTARAVSLATCFLLAGNPLPVCAKADPDKVLRIAFEAADDGFDTVRTNSLYTTWLAMNVFENLLRYDYLARPAKLVPGVAEAMPEISDGGKTYTIRIKKGIYFTPDPVFKGVRRELTAMDFVYSVKRLMDPANLAPSSSDFEGKLVGMDAVVAAARKSGKFDYSARIEGVKALDRYTLQYRLNDADYTFQYLMADSGSVAVAREVIEFYGSESGRHPVGTGPYMLKQYVPRSKIILEANPDYRGYVWDFQSSGEPWDEQVIRDMKGKSMPQIGRVEVSIIEEPQSRWLAFDSGQIDIDLLAESAAPRVLNGGQLKPEFGAKGVSLYRFTDPGTVRTYFNFKDPVVGGYSKEKVALRRAIALGFDVDAVITQAYFGQAVRAQSDVPNGVVGFDPKYRNSTPYNPQLANLLLDRFGYKKGADGFRTQPDGKPLVLQIHAAPNARDQTKMEVWRTSMNKIGLAVQFHSAGFADNLKSAYLCKLPMFGFGITASIPDASDFLSGYYGPNALRGNYGCYQSDAYDAAYRQLRIIPDGPQRNALVNKMNRILEADTTRVAELWRVRNWVFHKRVKGYKKHPIVWADWMYLDVDKP
jgi:ABC-type transport system substrate-binding protein